MPLESCSDSRIQDQFCVPFELAFRDALHSSGRADAVLGQDGRFGTALRGTGPRRFAGSWNDELAGSAGLAFDALGNLWVADRDYNRILRFDRP